MFADAVTTTGASQWLAPRSFDRWGQCAFTPREIEAAFAALVGWVSSGRRP